MTSVLILAPETDPHAGAVHKALTTKGHKVTQIVGSDFPSRRSMSLSYTRGHHDIEFVQDGNLINMSDFDVVWRRRGEFPEIDLLNIHPDDRKFAHAEAVDALNGWREVSVASGARWINPVEPALRSRNKPFQLIQAQKSGLTLPNTLISNDANEIRRFYNANDKRIIYKPLTPAAFTEGDKTLATFVDLVTDEMLEDADLLALTPGIYQSFINKAYELRVNMFGRKIVTAKINNQGNARTEIDWRPNVYETSLELYELPQEIKDKLYDFMDRMGLVFGAVDLIKDKNGDYVFLEVNQMGQFLWIDQMLPEANLLGTMCDFIGHC